MSKKKQKVTSDDYDINELIAHIEKNSRPQEPVDYNAEKMAVYGANINLKRHICEIRDGVKPVQRRIITVMYLLGLLPGKETKSSQVLGEIIKKYHPHGIDALYCALVYIGQPWRNNVALVETSTNFGSAFKPDGYAAFRYTECCLSEFAYDCFFKDWKLTSPKNDMTVDWIDNYDGSTLEPMYLPAKYPLFLINWHEALCL